VFLTYFQFCWALVSTHIPDLGDLGQIWHIRAGARRLYADILVFFTCGGPIPHTLTPFGRLRHVKCNMSPLRGEKPKNHALLPVTNKMTERFRSLPRRRKMSDPLQIAMVIEVVRTIFAPS